MKLRIHSFLAAICLLPPLWAGAAARITEFTLGNGMKVIVNEDHRAPIVEHTIWYKTGSVDERNGVTGVAHALEHMMFKGTRKMKSGEFSRRVAALGGRENAFTTRDHTTYFQQVNVAHLETVMALEADRMVNLLFDQNEFINEMRVVMEERRLRTDDQPRGLLFEAMNATAFTAHPYRNPVIGWMDDLENMQLDDIKAWYRQWYAPNNATMVVSGDVTPKEVRQLAEKHFGKIKPKKQVRTRPQKEPEQKGIKRVAVKAPAENAYVMLAFKVPAFRHVEKDDESFALAVLSAVLGGYDNARLAARLVRTQRAANTVNAGYSGVGRGPALFILGGVPATNITTQQLEALLRTEIERIAQEGVSEAELRRVKTNLIAERIYSRDSISHQAMEIGMMEMSGFSWRDIDRIIERLRSVTSEQVQAVAKKYFHDDTLTVATLIPLPPENKRLATPITGLRH